jgi:hypothetical protein
MMRSVASDAPAVRDRATRPELASLGAVPGMARKGCSCPAIFVVTLLLLFNLDVLLAVKLTVV